MNSKIKNIFERLFSAAVGCPVIFALIYIFPQQKYLALNIFVIVVCVLGAVEFAGILKKKDMELFLAEAVILGALPPIAATLYVSFNWSVFWIASAVLVCVLYCLMSCAFMPAGKLDKAGLRLAAGFSVIFYPGMCMCCMIFLSKLVFADTLIMVFLLTVIMNDSAAWFFGMLFGKNNKGIIAASPNKSIAGFIGGFAGSMTVCIAASVIKPDVFVTMMFPSTISGVILGLTTGIAATVGDLAESALKRSVGLKDSGILIPGRGGMLDSIDSIAFAAPVFYIVYRILFIELFVIK
ncbi:MAG: phosphatidate cytidylyltransferase [Spirochaetaceae bacterium]|jgi:phosphatidate cytidylyltransferase|nr:phosphatidate cytidylyltransferase [Spirochaetaceae bacterium]